MSSPEIAAEIAKQLHRIHQVEVPCSKEPQLWNNISNFLEKASNLIFNDKGKQARYETISFKEVLEEVNALKVIVLNECSDSPTIKLVLPLTEICLAMEIISCFSDRTKHKQNTLLLLSKSGQLYLYNDSRIEHYLLQSQSKSTPSLPDHFVVKVPFSDSSITISNLYTGYSVEPNTVGEEQLMLVKKYSNLFLFDKRERDGIHLSSTNFTGITKTTSLYVTGHQDGAINFWDASCPLLFPILSIKIRSTQCTEGDGGDNSAMSGRAQRGPRCGCQNWYCVSKTMAEKEALIYAEKHGLDIVSVCPSTWALCFNPL